MKIFAFDIKTGKKGKHIDTFIHSGNGQRIGKCKKTGTEVFDFIINDDGKNITADEWIEDAVTCCFGKVDGKWWWGIIPSQDIIDKCIKRNLKMFGTEFITPENMEKL